MDGNDHKVSERDQQASSKWTAKPQQSSLSSSLHPCPFHLFWIMGMIFKISYNFMTMRKRRLPISSSAPSLSTVRNWWQLLSVAVFCLLVAELFESFNPTVSSVFTYPTSEWPYFLKCCVYPPFFTLLGFVFLHSYYDFLLLLFLPVIRMQRVFQALLALSLSLYSLTWLLKP